VPACPDAPCWTWILAGIFVHPSNHISNRWDVVIQIAEKYSRNKKYSCIEIRVGFCAQDEKIPIADPSIVSPTTPIQPLHKDFVSPSLNGKRAIKQQSIKLETPKMDFFTVLFITPMPWRERLLQNDRFVMVSIMSSPTVCRRCRNLVIRLDESKCLHH